MSKGLPAILASLALLQCCGCMHTGGDDLSDLLKDKAAAPRDNVEIRNVRIRTDSSVDCSSPQAIAVATLKGASNEERILNFWNWYRRIEWHYKEWPGRRDLAANLMSQGQTLCASHAALKIMVLKAGGYRIRPVYFSEGGHTFVEVFYDSAWHAMDSMTGFFVYSRNEPRHILSLAEMKADPSLVRKAIEEDRVPANFLSCAREPEINKLKALPWSHYKPLKEMIKYYANGTPSASVGKEGDSLSAVYNPDRMKVNLKPGEVFNRVWDLEPGRFPVDWMYPEDEPVGPYHRCGHNDEFDRVNFPYWEPYCKSNYFVYKTQGTNENPGPITIARCYRYLTNGRYERHLPAADLLAQSSISSRVRLAGGYLLVDMTGGVAPTGMIEIATSFPYFISDADITIKYRRPSGRGLLAVQVLENQASGDRRNPLRTVPRTIFEADKTGDVTETFSIGRFEYGKLDGNRYVLRLFVSKGVAVESMTISTVFMHNMFAGPNLVPGNNNVTVAVDNGADLKKHPLLVTYRFDDGAGWTEERIVEKEVDSSPFEFQINVKGPRHPRMKSVTVEAK